jgi:hypothetical protein
MTGYAALEASGTAGYAGLPEEIGVAGYSAGYTTEGAADGYSGTAVTVAMGLVIVTVKVLAVYTLVVHPSGTSAVPVGFAHLVQTVATYVVVTVVRPVGQTSI